MRRGALGPLLSLAVCAALPAQDPATYRVDRIDTGFAYTEGPAWSRDGFLIFSDVPSGRILKLVPGHRGTAWRENAPGASGNAIDAQGRVYTCETRARRVVRADARGKVEVLAERWEGKRLNAPNDIVLRKDGHAWFTDPAFGYQSDTRELDFYGVFHITPRRELKLVAKTTGRPNGIALSPNGRVLYVADSDEHLVRAWDLDGKGEATGERVFASGIDGVPGGIRTDDKGNLYVAAAGIAMYSPEGKLVRTIPVEERPSNCVFGDADLKSLYITAGTSIYRVRLDVAEAVQH